MEGLDVPVGACVVADEGRCGATYAVRVGITGLAASPAGVMQRRGTGGQGSRPGQRLVHLDQSCPDHPLDVACQGP